MNEVVEKRTPLEKAARILAIITFSLTTAALLTAFISDASVFAQQIVTFFIAIFGSALVFLFACVCLLVSIILIFGVVLLKNNGFWPMQWASSAFHEILKDAVVTSEQISILITIRVVLIIICIITFISSIVVLALAKAVKKENPERKQKLTKTFGIISLIFSILGVCAAIVLILILKAI